LSPGIYDSIHNGTLEEKSKAVRERIAQDFSLKSIPFYRDDSQSYILLSDIPELQSDDDLWCNILVRKGVPVEEIAFLADVLIPDPTERLSAKEIIRSGYLDE
jgi:male germ cell-associated kinase